jgi:rod shape-determining protein MreC
VAAVLVVLSIALITIYFRESDNGGLHQVQSAGAAVLRPFEIAANRVAQPFRDTYGYFAGLADAKSENKRLRRENDQLRQEVTQNATAVSDNAELRSLLRFTTRAAFPAGYTYHAATIIARPNPDFEQQVTIDAGKTAGIRKDDAVVTSDGLAGSVTKAMHNTSLVTLLTDDSAAVSARDVQTGAIGIVKKGASGMSFDDVTKDMRVESGDALVTAGWKSEGLSSIYPRGIPIGTVTFVGQNEVDLYKHVQLEPFADLKSMSVVLVLIPNDR